MFTVFGAQLLMDDLHAKHARACVLIDLIYVKMLYRLTLNMYNTAHYIGCSIVLNSHVSIAILCHFMFGLHYT